MNVWSIIIIYQTFYLLFQNNQKIFSEHKVNSLFKRCTSHMKETFFTFIYHFDVNMLIKQYLMLIFFRCENYFEHGNKTQKFWIGTLKTLHQSDIWTAVVNHKWFECVWSLWVTWVETITSMVKWRSEKSLKFWWKNSKESYWS